MGRERELGEEGRGHVPSSRRSTATAGPASECILSVEPTAAVDAGVSVQAGAVGASVGAAVGAPVGGSHKAPEEYRATSMS